MLMSILLLLDFLYSMFLAQGWDEVLLDGVHDLSPGGREYTLTTWHVPVESPVYKQWKEYFVVNIQ